MNQRLVWSGMFVALFLLCIPLGARAEPSETLLNLTQHQLRRYQNCQEMLLPEEKEELTKLAVTSRNTWLDTFCDPKQPFLKCRPRLTEEQRVLYLEEPLSKRVAWLRINCCEAPPDPLYLKELSKEKELHIWAANQQSYDVCKPKLTPDQQLYYEEVNILEQQQLLTVWCTAMAITLGPPDNWSISSKDLENAAERHNWSSSRITAHSTFWPGVLLLTTGLIIGSLLDHDYLGYWVPEVAVGSVLLLIGTGTGIHWVRSSHVQQNQLPPTKSKRNYRPDPTEPFYY